MRLRNITGIANFAEWDVKERLREEPLCLGKISLCLVEVSPGVCLDLLYSILSLLVSLFDLQVGLCDISLPLTVAGVNRILL
jgi:hypothetical protein